MTQAATSRSLFYDLFSPMPASPEGRPDTADHVAEYVESTSGAWDLFRVGNHVFSALHLCMKPSHHLSDLVGRATEVFDSAGVALSIPQLFSDLNAWRKSFNEFFNVQDLPYSDPLRDKKVMQAGKKSFLDTVTVTNTLSQILLFAEGVKLIVIQAARLQLINRIFDITGAIYDGDELFREYAKLKQYEAPSSLPQNQAEAAKLEEKKALCCFQIAKDVSSLALTALSLSVATLEAYGVAMSTISALPFVTLGLSGFWLTMKITAYFYEKMVVESPSPVLV